VHEGHWIGGYHALAANTVLILAGLHAVVALSHHYIMRDDVLARMAPVFHRFRRAGAR
jgi:cytochrome b561